MDELKRAQLTTELAAQLYDWLPGKHHPYGKTFTFEDAAATVGLRSEWVGGSKRPAIETLLDAAFRKAKLRDLVLVVVKEGIKYRARRGPEITRAEFGKISALVEALGLGIPELSSRDLLDGFPVEARSVAFAAKSSASTARLASIREKFQQIESNPDPVGRGYEFQDILTELFDLFALAPRGPFRVSGEEIDGSFDLDGETYLLEARWRKKETAKSDLVVFQQKVESKSGFSRGLFVSMGAYTTSALEEFSAGRVPRIVLASKKDLESVLSGATALDKLIQRKVRHLSETGLFAVEQ